MTQKENAKTFQIVGRFLEKKISLSFLLNFLLYINHIYNQL
jgi:hypothetical protein